MLEKHFQSSIMILCNFLRSCKLDLAFEILCLSNTCDRKYNSCIIIIIFSNVQTYLFKLWSNVVIFSLQYNRIFCNFLNINLQWREVARELNGVIRMGAVNCHDDWMLCRMQGINGYPSLRIYPTVGFSFIVKLSLFGSCSKSVPTWMVFSTLGE